MRHIFFCTLMLLAGLAQPALAQYSGFDDPGAGGGSAAGAPAGAAADLIAVNPEQDAGTSSVGGKAKIIALFRNTSRALITVDKIELVPSAGITAEIANNQCANEPLKPGVDCAVTVTVNTTQEGDWRLGLLVNHNGPSKLTTMNIKGMAGNKTTASDKAPSDIEAFPKDIDFGDATGRTTLIRSFALHNTTSAPIEISDIQLVASPQSGFEVSAKECEILQPGQACVATISWKPRQVGKGDGVLIVRHNGPSRVMRVAIEGEFKPSEIKSASRFPDASPGEGLLIADREEVDFGGDVDGAASITVSVVNAGDKPVTLKSVRLAGSDNGLSLASDSCARGRTLAANAACALTINWLPRRVGPVIDDIKIVHDGARGILVLPVRGKAAQPVSNTNLPLITSSRRGSANSSMAEELAGSVPKLTTKLDESVLGSMPSSATSSLGLPVKQKSLAGSETTPTLDGYSISSLGPDRAIIAGPKGRLVVMDGEPVMISGAQWIPAVTENGVELIGNQDTVLLAFDQSLNVTQSALATGGYSAGTTGAGGAGLETISNTLTPTGVTAATGATATP